MSTRLLPVVLVHGFMQDARTWDAVCAALPKHIQAITPTLVPPDGAHSTLEGLAAQLRAAVGGNAPALFVGYSMGGRIMQAYAREYPETLAGLVLESAGLGPETETDRMQQAAISEDRARRFETFASIREAVDWWERLPLFQTQSSLDSRVRKQAREMRLSCNLDVLAQESRLAGAHTMPLASQTRAELSALPCPVYYVYGVRDEKYSRVADTLRDYKSANIHLLPFDAGHNVHMECPQAFAETIVRIADGLTKSR